MVKLEMGGGICEDESAADTIPQIREIKPPVPLDADLPHVLDEVVRWWPQIDSKVKLNRWSKASRKPETTSFNVEWE
jgi:hypothetical protein